jgi:hypothetical protein
MITTTAMAGGTMLSMGGAVMPAAASVTKTILWNTVSMTSGQLLTMLGAYEGLSNTAPELHKVNPQQIR